MESEMVYQGSNREWLVTSSPGKWIDKTINGTLQGLANSMRAQQLFVFEGEIFYRTEGYDIYRVNTGGHGGEDKVGQGG